MIPMLRQMMVGASSYTSSHTVPVPILRRGRGCLRFSCGPLSRLGSLVKELSLKMLISNINLTWQCKDLNKSGIVKLPRHKNNKTDLRMFKKNQSHTNYCCIKHVVYHCILLFHNTSCDWSRLYCTATLQHPPSWTLGRLYHKLAKVVQTQISFMADIS